jgi:hypothetical protein
MLPAPPVRIRSRTALTVAASGVLAAALAAGAAPPSASAGQVDTPIYRGDNRFEVAVPSVPGLLPPTLGYRTLPANANCRLTELSYVARADQRGRRPVGRAALTVRCGNVPVGARVRLNPGRPLVRRVAIHNGDGRLNVRLDKPPGSVSPRVLLQTTPRGRGSCRARSLRDRETRTRLTIAGRFRCRGLPRNAHAVLSVGGVIASSRTDADPADGPPPSHARASRAAGPGLGPAAGGTAAAVVCRNGMTQQPGSPADRVLAMTEDICVAPGQSVEIRPYAKGCPSGYLNSANPWPGFTYDVAGAPNGWWSAGTGPGGGWAFNNSSSDPITLVLSWNCWRAGALNTALPTITGDAKVGGTLRCNPGSWASGVSDFDFVWVMQHAGGGSRTIGRGDTYPLTSAEARQRLSCLVTGYTADGTAIQPSVSSPPSDPVVDAPPRMLTPPALALPGSQGPFVGAFVGDTIMCDPGSWDQAGPAPFTYQWLANGTPLAGQTGQLIRVPDFQAQLSCTATAHNVLGTGAATSNAATIRVCPGGFPQCNRWPSCRDTGGNPDCI